MSEFKNMRFDVRDAEHSKQIQEYLFSIGYQWKHSGKAFRHFGEQTIFADIAGAMFIEVGYPHNFTPYKLLVEMIPKYTVVPVRNTVEVGDKTYYEDELAEALSKIKPVEK